MKLLVSYGGEILKVGLGMVKKWHDKTKSLKFSLFVYIFIGVVMVAVLTYITIVWCNSWEYLLLNKYDYLYLEHINFIRINDICKLGMTTSDGVLYCFVIIFRTFAVFIYGFGIISFVSKKFYKDKIQEPLNIIKSSTEKIKNNDLAFNGLYESDDEMAEICKAVDDMRMALIKKDEVMKEIDEKQKLLNSSLAHDLRTPLTVMEGYIEMINTYYPAGKISEEKMIEVLGMVEKQVVRLKGYSHTVNEIHSLDGVSINKEAHQLKELKEVARKVMDGLQNKFPKIECLIRLKTGEDDTRSQIMIDMNVFNRVIDNLLVNGFSYAKSLIEVVFELEGGFLKVYVRDDGEGFSKESLYEGTRAYFSSRKDIMTHGEAGHYGIGLTVCKTLCDKHGGGLFLDNSVHGGGIACGIFDVENL